MILKNKLILIIIWFIYIYICVLYTMLKLIIIYQPTMSFAKNKLLNWIYWILYITLVLHYKLPKILQKKNKYYTIYFNSLNY